MGLFSDIFETISEGARDIGGAIFNEVTKSHNAEAYIGKDYISLIYKWEKIFPELIKYVKENISYLKTPKTGHYTIKDFSLDCEPSLDGTYRIRKVSDDEWRIEVCLKEFVSKVKNLKLTYKKNDYILKLGFSNCNDKNIRRRPDAEGSKLAVVFGKKDDVNYLNFSMELLLEGHEPSKNNNAMWGALWFVYSPSQNPYNNDAIGVSYSLDDFLRYSGHSELFTCILELIKIVSEPFIEKKGKEMEKERKQKKQEHLLAMAAKQKELEEKAEKERMEREAAENESRQRKIALDNF